jgi:Na+-driven multidrug efflux pump
LGGLVLQGAVNSLGADAMAAYATAGRIESIVISPMFAFNVAVVTFTAQNRGAEQWNRIRRAVLISSGIVSSIGIVLGTIQFAAAPFLVGIFIPAESTIPAALAISYIRITAWLMAIQGMKFVLRGAVQGMGNSTVPTISTFVELVVRAVVAFALVGIHGLPGIAWAAPTAWVVAVAMNAAMWLRLRSEMLTKERADARLNTELTTRLAEPPAALPSQPHPARALAGAGTTMARA